MFSYTPVSREEAEKESQFPLMEPGIYNFTTVSATFEISKPKLDKKTGETIPGNPMIKLQHVVWDGEGKEHTVYDYLISTKKMAWKTIQYCDAVGLSKVYDEGKFNEHSCQGKSGKVSIIIQAGQAKEGGGFYKDKNSVEFYVKDESPEQPFNDDLPF